MIWPGFHWNWKETYFYILVVFSVVNNTTLQSMIHMFNCSNNIMIFIEYPPWPEQMKKCLNYLNFCLISVIPFYYSYHSGSSLI